MSDDKLQIFGRLSYRFRHRIFGGLQDIVTDSMDQVLGAWEDHPKRRLDVDATSVALDSKDAFVLTRIDGQSTTAELCSITGLGERETLVSLERLVKAQLVQIEAADGDRRMIALNRRNRTVRPSPQKADDVPVFQGVDEQDAAWLTQFGQLGLVGGRPLRGTGSNRFGGVVFDRELLKEADSLAVEQKKEILFLFQSLEKIDHFELFGVPPTDDKKALRRAFFEFSRRFHPDTVFRVDVGPFRELIEAIFKRGTEAYELLSTNHAFRERYVRAVNARNQFHQDELSKQVADRKRASLGRLRANANSRKEELRQRLKRNTTNRSTGNQERKVGVRVDRARQFYDEGIAHYENESFNAATTALKLAANYDPNNEQYAQALELAELRMNEVHAERQWKRGYVQESLGHIDEAIEAYFEATDVLPRADYCAHLAQLLLKFDRDLHRAASLASSAVDSEPGSVEYKLILGRIYEHAKLNIKAKAAYQSVLSIDSKNDEAKRAVKRLR